MARYSATVRDQNQAIVIGALVAVQRQDGTTPVLTDDNGASLTNPLTTDQYGTFYFNSEIAFYDLLFYYGGRLVTIERGVAVGGAQNTFDITIQMTQLLVQTENARDAAVAAQETADQDAAQTAIDRIQTGTDADNSAASAALASTRLGQVVAAAAGTPSYPFGSQSNVPVGAVGYTSLVGGSGGTNGTFALGFTGGNYLYNPTATFTVAGGTVTLITITGAGLYIGASPTAPTPTFAASSGLSGASATITNGVLVASGKNYFAVASDGLSETLYFNNAGTATIAPQPFAVYSNADSTLANAGLASGSFNTSTFDGSPVQLGLGKASFVRAAATVGSVAANQPLTRIPLTGEQLTIFYRLTPYTLSTPTGNILYRIDGPGTGAQSNAITLDKAKPGYGIMTMTGTGSVGRLLNSNASANFTLAHTLFIGSPAQNSAYNSGFEANVICTFRNLIDAINSFPAPEVWDATTRMPLYSAFYGVSGTRVPFYPRQIPYARQRLHELDVGAFIDAQNTYQVNPLPLIEAMGDEYFEIDPGKIATTGAVFVGSISTTTLTVTSVTSGTIRSRATLYGLNVLAGTKVIGGISINPDGTGTYTISPSQAVASQTIKTKNQSFNIYVKDPHDPVIQNRYIRTCPYYVAAATQAFAVQDIGWLGTSYGGNVRQLFRDSYEATGGAGSYNGVGTMGVAPDKHDTVAGRSLAECIGRNQATIVPGSTNPYCRLALPADLAAFPDYCFATTGGTVTDRPNYTTNPGLGTYYIFDWATWAAAAGVSVGSSLIMYCDHWINDVGFVTTWIAPLVADYGYISSNFTSTFANGHFVIVLAIPPAANGADASSSPIYQDGDFAPLYVKMLGAFKNQQGARKHLLSTHAHMAADVNDIINTGTVFATDTEIGVVTYQMNVSTYIHAYGANASGMAWNMGAAALCIHQGVI